MKPPVPVPAPVLKPSLDIHRVLGKTDGPLFARISQDILAKRWTSAFQKARGLEDLTARKLVIWLAIQDQNAPLSFEDVDAFLRDNPNWPRQGALRWYAETRMPAGLPPEQVLAWFGDRTPVSGTGKLRLGEAELARGNEKVGTYWIRQAWVEHDFPHDLESAVLSAHGSLLTPANHVDRMDRLIWERNYGAARRLMRRLPKDAAKLADARLRLARSKPGVDAAIKRVPEVLQEHPGLIFERVQWRRKRNMDEETWPLLDKMAASPKSPPYPARWWRERRIQIRTALLAKNYEQAYALTRNHGLTSGVNFADAEWIAGWIALRFLKKPDLARRHFETLEGNVRYPISRARALYWLGEASLAKNDIPAAENYFALASRFSNTFYGQLATSNLIGLESDKAEPYLKLIRSPAVDPSVLAVVRETELARAAEISSTFTSDSIAKSFLEALAEENEQDAHYRAVAALAESLNFPHIAVQLGKDGMRKGLRALDIAYPTLDLPPLSSDKPEVEEAFVLAIIRQESEFNAEAVSHVRAQGLMQLMPATARYLARGAGLSFNEEWLTEKPGFNTKLGRLYLRQLLDDYDGSYILAAAAYNAGSSRVDRWMEEYGDPRKPGNDPVDWIERIPFSETRNYVQRVMESVAVYRNILDGKDYKIVLAQDLIRTHSNVPLLEADTRPAVPTPDAVMRAGPAEGASAASPRNTAPVLRGGSDIHVRSNLQPGQAVSAENLTSPQTSN